VAAHALAAELEDALPDSVELEPVIARYRVRKARQMPDFEAFFESRGRARAAAPDASGSSSTFLVDLAPDAGVHRTVREAMVDIEGREVVVVAFIEPGANELIEEIGKELPDTAASRVEPLTRAGFYRSLRHTLQRAGS